MKKHVCPWWIGYILASPLRRLQHNPEKILSPFVKDGMTVLEPGPGMGFFSIPMANLVGPAGKVVVVDIQDKMLRGVEKRARKAGVRERIDARLAKAESMGLDDLAGKVDFGLAFYMVHEFPDARRFFEETHAALKPGGRMLLVEPVGHVSADKFAQCLTTAESAGFRVESRPAIGRSRAAVLVKSS